MGKQLTKTLWHIANPNLLEAARIALLKRFPNMHLSVETDDVWVRGTLPIEHDGEVLTRYQLAVKLPPDYPASPPAIWETGGRIPRILDRHVMTDTGALCIGVPADLWLQQKGHFEISEYLAGPVTSYLTGNTLFEQGQPWPHGEWSHGAAGIIEYYGELLGNRDPRAVLKLFQYLIAKQIKGHWPCPCLGGKVLRRCHGPMVWELHKILPITVIGSSIEALQQFADQWR